MESMFNVNKMESELAVSPSATIKVVPMVTSESSVLSMTTTASYIYTRSMTNLLVKISVRLALASTFGA